MKFLILAQRFLNSKRNHFHGGSCSRSLHAFNPMGWSKSYEQMQSSSSSLFSSHYYSTTRILNAPESSNRLNIHHNKHGNNKKKVDLEIMSRETIKPASPTPSHQRIFNLSIIDQCMYDVYIPTVLFFPNTRNASDSDVVTKRLKQLKEALSDVLTRFYPLAGKVKDNLHIECNDEGVYYIEAQVNQTMEDFLRNPCDEQVRDLTPESPRTPQSSVGNYIIGVQVNIFKCGGIGLGLSLSHKIVDGETYFIFMKAWATAARGSPEKVSPSFVASEIFPSYPGLEYTLPSKLVSTKMLTTKRFVFDSAALALLKTQPIAGKQPTRMEATSAVIWKAATKAASTIRSFTPQSPHVLLSLVNLRKRASPSLPEYSIGNIITVACAICFPSSEPDLPTLVREIRESIVKINSTRREREKGHEKTNETLKRLNHLTDMIRVGDCMLASSLLNNRIYEVDFGWGKPIWSYATNPGMSRFLFLNETLKGGGVEAILTLSPEEMEIIECDPEILSYATINPSPLRFSN